MKLVNCYWRAYGTYRAKEGYLADKEFPLFEKVEGEQNLALYKLIEGYNWTDLRIVIKSLWQVSFPLLILFTFISWGIETDVIIIHSFFDEVFYTYSICFAWRGWCTFLVIIYMRSKSMWLLDLRLSLLILVWCLTLGLISEEHHSYPDVLILPAKFIRSLLESPLPFGTTTTFDF